MKRVEPQSYLRSFQPSRDREGAFQSVEKTTSRAQIDANRANSQLATGPTTDAGKAISAQNRRSHAFAGCFQILPWEGAKDFVILRNELRQHYQPLDVIEQGYVNRLAEHTWLRQRSLNLQLHCYDPACDLTHINDEKQFAFAHALSKSERKTHALLDSLTPFLLARPV